MATLGSGDTFGELGVLSHYPRSADAVAKTKVRVFKILQQDVEDLVASSPEVEKDLLALAKSRISDLEVKTQTETNPEWKKQCLEHLEHEAFSVSSSDILAEGKAASHGNAAVAIWLGILIDGIPESLVIGMLAISTQGISLAFIAGVFLANMPEAMSSAVSMRQHGMSLKKIYLMWGSICFLTGVGAYVGSMLFSGEPTGSAFYLVLAIEGAAAGAMLTMIAETMLPEAYEQGGSVVGLSTLGGFLAALLVKVL
ncbi:MAG: ZIP family metal transporter [Pseudobdellovibrionaceae bacterium]|nr:ZIP family metal transporter [Bdellovibrionales bacterium]USN46397.1 MAG: ZIP family metal transporter [Pseudobdellovibrionaceae bacterium]